MLSLNIKSNNYMCIDIATDSVIHEHIVKKLKETMREWDAVYHPNPEWDMEEGYYSKLFGSSDPEDDTHDLTMLDSFHISLGKPPEGIKPQIIPIDIYEPGLELAVGYITLSDIKVSETENKKSAWIDVKNFTWTIINGDENNTYGNYIRVERSNHQVLAKYKRMMYLDDNFPTWHISLANLTGNPHDSIARPENCIIDTITS